MCGTSGLPYPTAELTWGLVLDLFRRITIEDQATRRGRWQTTLGLGLNGKTLGVIGLGATRLARGPVRARLRDGSAGLEPEPHRRARRRGRAPRWSGKDELLARSDVVSIHLVLSDRTRGLIGARELALMKRTAYLVNTSRGPIVDEAALFGRCRTARSPAPASTSSSRSRCRSDHPSSRLPNTVITPHLGYVTEETYRIFFGHALEDVKAFLRGAPVRVLRP